MSKSKQTGLANCHVRCCSEQSNTRLPRLVPRPAQRVIHQLRLNRLSSTDLYQALIGQIMSPVCPVSTLWQPGGGSETFTSICPKWAAELQRDFGDSTYTRTMTTWWNFFCPACRNRLTCHNKNNKWCVTASNQCNKIIEKGSLQSGQNCREDILHAARYGHRCRSYQTLRQLYDQHTTPRSIIEHISYLYTNSTKYNLYLLVYWRLSNRKKATVVIRMLTNRHTNLYYDEFNLRLYSDIT